MGFKVTVKDNLAPRGHFIEEWDVTTKPEADAWLKQFRKEYPKDDGYTIKCKEQ